MIHDPLCSHVEGTTMWDCTECDKIAKVRSSERAATLDEVITEVEDDYEDSGSEFDEGYIAGRDTALARLRALRNKDTHD